MKYKSSVNGSHLFSEMPRAGSAVGVLRINECSISWKGKTMSPSA